MALLCEVVFLGHQTPIVPWKVGSHSFFPVEQRNTIFKQRTVHMYSKSSKPIAKRSARVEREEDKYGKLKQYGRKYTRLNEMATLSYGESFFETMTLRENYFISW